MTMYAGSRSNCCLFEGFADDFPVTTILDKSLEKLNEHLTEPVLMNRFRPR